jgi:hypothetical protein
MSLLYLNKFIHNLNHKKMIKYHKNLYFLFNLYIYNFVIYLNKYNSNILTWIYILNIIYFNNFMTFNFKIPQYIKENNLIQEKKK